MRVTNMIRRATFFCGAVLAGLLILAGPAKAQTDSAPPSDDNYTALCSPLSVSNANPAAGDTVTVSGTAATAGATIVIVLNNSDVLGNTTSAADRTFSVPVTIPADASGAITLQAFQLGDNTDPVVGCPSQVADLSILAPIAAEPLARTGTNSTLPLTRLGFGLVAAGGLVILVTRRRKSTTQVSA
jgi:hypothetical protein